ncbi:MAG: hypothetical protein QM757_45885 [Paludibaculum sp.]
MSSYNENNETVIRNEDRHSSGGTVTKVAVAIALVAALGGWWYQSNQVSSVRQEMAQSQQKFEQLQSQMQTSATVAKAQVDETIAKMNDEVTKARQEALASSQRAAKQQAGKVLTTLTAKNEELTKQLEEYKQATDQKSTQVDEALNGIKGDVGTVRTDVDSTRTDLSQTKEDLKRMTGDMGVMSGLIATNSTELAELRKLGEKDYFEFTLPRNGQAQKVGEIRLALKKTDVKRNKFTMNVLADDKTVEKKDKNVNEPVQFYTAGARTPYEVVVNEIRKDQVIGYLAVPKVKTMARR